MSNNFRKKPRFIYEYNGEKHQVPEKFVYQIHSSKGGGFDISEAFFTWAFNKHGISIVDIQILYASEDRSPKKPKDQVAASSTFFVATVKGRDRRNVEKVGDGESGNESITNFQRGYPAGLAIKRAKVNMGKEFFNLVDLKAAIDCRDTVVEFGQDKGKTLEELAQTPQGLNTIRWFASDNFNGDGVFKEKAQEFLELYANNIQSSQPSNRTNNNTYNNSGGSNSQSSFSPMTAEQKDIMSKYRQSRFLTDEQIMSIARELFGNNFTWKNATYEQGNKFIERLKQLYGNI